MAIRSPFLLSGAYCPVSVQPKSFLQLVHSPTHLEFLLLFNSLAACELNPPPPPRCCVLFIVMFSVKSPGLHLHRKVGYKCPKHVEQVSAVAHRTPTTGRTATLSGLGEGKDEAANPSLCLIVAEWTKWWLQWSQEVWRPRRGRAFSGTLHRWKLNWGKDFVWLCQFHSSGMTFLGDLDACFLFPVFSDWTSLWSGWLVLGVMANISEWGRALDYFSHFSMFYCF